MLAFSFASRTFAYRRLAHNLSRSMSAFSSFMRKYLDTVIIADHCTQYIDEMGITTKSPAQLITNLRATFKCIQNAVLKLFSAKCQFGTKEVDFFGRTITADGVSPQKQKITIFLEKVKFTRFKKTLQRFIGILIYYRNYIPVLAEKIFLAAPKTNRK